MTDKSGEILTLDEVAAYLKIGKRPTNRLAAVRKIPTFKVGGLAFFMHRKLTAG